LDHLSDLQDAELPVSQRAKFVQLRETLTHGKQLDPEIVIEAMNDDEVAEAARQILTLYDGIMDAARSGPSSQIVQVHRENHDQPVEKLDIEAVVRDPADYFAAPMDVVNDSRFTHDEKHRILESWTLDAQLPITG